MDNKLDLDAILSELTNYASSSHRVFSSGYEDVLEDRSDWQDPNEIDQTEFEAIAIRLMDAMTENKIDSYILLKDPIIADWWGTIVKERTAKQERLRKQAEANRKREEDDRARKELLSRLTAEEKRLLGL